jgi:hypothetical protein
MRPPSAGDARVAGAGRLGRGHEESDAPLVAAGARRASGRSAAVERARPTELCKRALLASVAACAAPAAAAAAAAAIGSAPRAPFPAAAPLTCPCHRGHKPLAHRREVLLAPPALQRGVHPFDNLCGRGGAERGGARRGEGLGAAGPAGRRPAGSWACRLTRTSSPCLASRLPGSDITKEAQAARPCHPACTAGPHAPTFSVHMPSHLHRWPPCTHLRRAHAIPPAPLAPMHPPQARTCPPTCTAGPHAPTIGASMPSHVYRWSSASMAATASSFDPMVTRPQPLVVGAPCGQRGGETQG